jgi:hypothetical protein
MRVRFVKWLVPGVSSVLLAYLAVIIWANAMMRLVAPHAIKPWGIATLVLAGLLVVETLALGKRRLWPLAMGTTLGMGLEWLPRALPAAGVLILGALFAAWWTVPPHQTQIGRTRGVPRPVRLTVQERFLHLHVLGPTGSGKSSSVLMPLIDQDLRHRYGVLVIEPKGDLTEAAYRQALACGRRVIRFNPLDPECPHYNPLAGSPDGAAEGIATALAQLGDAGHPYYQMASRIQLLYSVRALKGALGNQADLGALLTFLRDLRWQKDIVFSLDDASVRQYFQEQWARSASQSREERQGLIYRLELLWANSALSRTLKAPHDFVWDDVLAESWVVLASLSLAELGQSARALGILLWHGLAQATYRRRPNEAHPPFFAYLDEFQEWVSDDLSHFLALARGYRVGLTLAHQDLGQLNASLVEAVLANARQRVILPGTAASDVARLQEGFAPYRLAVPLRYLSQGLAVVQLTQRGRLRPPAIVRLPYFPLGGAR